MQFLSILTSIALASAVMLSPSLAAKAQNTDTSRLDDVVLDMAQAYKQRDRRRLTALLPQVRGYVLEPWGAYWELSARLDDAGPTEIQDFMNRYSGTYQEDRLRADYLLQLGRQRDWQTFNREYPKYRMNDDKSVRCYALLAEHLSGGTDVNKAVYDTWLSQKDADEGCRYMAQTLLPVGVLTPADLWTRARHAAEFVRAHRAHDDSAGIPRHEKIRDMCRKVSVR